MTSERLEVSLEEPQAALERAIIDDYLRARGHDPRLLRYLPPAQVRDLLREAALYAAARLTEHEARAHYVHEIHGALDPLYKRPKVRP